ncbi:hypothetical protein [Massilia endophytica]|uniref:hypothetical protein n=1 Tax=Massilia endophytica TaxID=2899220 RepID=UPI001E517D03|nr:hypothetical protein [Massilia endophytica]UGQ45457.1 hypothetical protein LSQ66_16910 [Massilia endophytica]
MFAEPDDSDDPGLQTRIETIVAQGPGGAFAVAGAAVAAVLAIWLAFYLLVFLARGGA